MTAARGKNWNKIWKPHVILSLNNQYSGRPPDRQTECCGYIKFFAYLQTCLSAIIQHGRSLTFYSLGPESNSRFITIFSRAVVGTARECAPTFCLHARPYVFSSQGKSGCTPCVNSIFLRIQNSQRLYFKLDICSQKAQINAGQPDIFHWLPRSVFNALWQFEIMLRFG